MTTPKMRRAARPAAPQNTSQQQSIIARCANCGVPVQIEEICNECQAWLEHFLAVRWAMRALKRRAASASTKTSSTVTRLKEAQTKTAKKRAEATERAKVRSEQLKKERIEQEHFERASSKASLLFCRSTNICTSRRATCGLLKALMAASPGCTTQQET